MQPFHEFECTGVDDEYVQTIDITDEARAEYEGDTYYRLRDNVGGELHNPYEDRFYREPTAEELAAAGPLGFMGVGGNGTISWSSRDWEDGRGYRAKIKFIPQGWEEIQVPVREVQTFMDWAVDYYGYDVIPPKAQREGVQGKYGWICNCGDGGIYDVWVVRRTNPNKHWDWWVKGGRWKNMLALVGTGRYVNQARKDQIDWEAMRSKKANAAREEHRKARTVIAGREVPNWSAMLGGVGQKSHEELDAIHVAYNTNPVVSDLRAAEIWDFGKGYARFDCTEDEYANRAARNAISTFAVVKDGQWYERGSMGWWGVVSGEMGEDEWNWRWEELVMGLPGDALLTIVDCHI